MSEAEGAIMQAHFGYWAGVIADGKAVVYGPVVDPDGTYGIAVVEVSDEVTARGIAADDPAIRSTAGFGFELHPMPDAMVRPQAHWKNNGASRRSNDPPVG
jgi:uncharacterized protein YciI